MERLDVGRFKGRAGIKQRRKYGRDEDNGEDGRLAVLHPEADLTAMGIGQLVVGIDMENRKR